MDDFAYMRLAMKLADQAAALGEIPVGALVVEDATGKILGQGFNRRETDHDPTAHAEVLAIRQAALALGSWRLSGCTMRSVEGPETGRRPCKENAPAPQSKLI